MLSSEDVDQSISAWHHGVTKILQRLTARYPMKATRMKGGQQQQQRRRRRCRLGGLASAAVLAVACASSSTTSLLIVVDAFQGGRPSVCDRTRGAADVRRNRPASSGSAVYGIFGDTGTKSSKSDDSVSNVSSPSPPDLLEWEVLVDQSKLSLDRGGSATLDAFVGLAPSTVKIQPVIMSKMIKSKGPLVRCTGFQGEKVCFDVSNVDSVDKVCRILTRHMKVTVSMKACDCLKWKYKGNGLLETGKVALAIDAYDNALATNVTQQEGIILLMRATAYLRRAGTHKKALKEIVNELLGMIPETSSFHTMFDEASFEPAIANSVFRRIMEDTMTQEKQFRRTQYRHGLYQYALLQAAQDSLRATQLMPNYATSWLRAGEILSELWKLKESAQYYERAIELDSSLSDSLVPVIDRLKRRQELLDNARAYGWSEDTLRLALDVAG